jgi:hypothetical protein
VDSVTRFSGTPELLVVGTVLVSRRGGPWAALLLKPFGNLGGHKARPYFIN